METQWYYSRGGGKSGPISGSDLKRLAETGELAPSDLVWRAGMSDWATAASVGVAAEAIPPPLPHSPPAPQSPAAPPPVEAKVTQRASRGKRSRVQPHVVIAAVGTLVALMVCITFAAYSLGRRQVATAAPRTKNAAEAAPRRVIQVASQADRTTSDVSASNIPPVAARANDPADDSSTAENVATTGPTRFEPMPLESAGSPIASPESKPDQPKKRPAPITAETPAATPPEQPAASPPPTTQTPESQPGESAEMPQRPHTLFQYLDIKRNPSFSISELATTSQNIHYQILSKLTVDPITDDETRTVTQIVEETRLVAADDLSRKTFAKSLADLKRQQYTYKLNKRGAVIEFTGHKKNLAALAVDLAAGKGFQITSVIDEDGWKEIAELTFLVPDPQSQGGATWQRQMTHDWGELGGWTGMTTFGWGDSNNELRTIGFKHDMRYIKPAAGGGGALPIKISDATFTPQEAGGNIHFDPEKNRVTSAQEVFQVTGNISAELLGQTVPLQVTERQLIDIRITDQRVDSQ